MAMSVLFKSLVVLCLYEPFTVNCVTIRTDIGDIIGMENNIKIAGIDFTVNTFFGIPYAKPPLDDLRYRKPVPHGRFEQPFYANEFGPACIQQQAGSTNFAMSEDCLTLNIYTPGDIRNSSVSYVVMIFIHGGGFDTGRGADFIGTNLVLGGDVIVVTLNYRLGFFGFMSTGDAHAPGNMGLWDQKLAIQWIHDHVENFGGDKSHVILFGQSAGATSILYQALNTQNSGLFQGIISQSFSSFKWNYDSKPYEKVMRVAQTFNCNTASKTDILQCLREVDAQNIQAAISSVRQGDPTVYDLRFLPTLDNDFIKFDPCELSTVTSPASNKILEFFRSLNLLGGFNSQEGAFYAAQWPEFGNTETFEPDKNVINDDLIPKTLNLFHDNDYNEALKQQVIAEYTDWTNPDSPQHLRQQLLKLITDLEFGVPTMQMLSIHAGVAGSDNNKTFLYHFTAPPEIIEVLPRPSWATGANHGDELLFLVGVPSPSNWEYILMSSMVTYWTNFAKSG